MRAGMYHTATVIPEKSQECEVQIWDMIFWSRLSRLENVCFGVPDLRFLKVWISSKFFCRNWSFNNCDFFLGSIQNKLSRLDLTFFQLFYVGLFKQSFPSRNWFYMAWKSSMNYAAWFIHYESSNRGMNNHKHLNNPDTFVIW